MTQTVKNTFKTHKTPLKRTKTAIQDTQNTALAQATEIPPLSERERIKSVACLLLDHLETIAKQHKARSQKAEATREEKNKTLFGEKKSCMESLVIVTDLILKLEKSAAPDSVVGAESGIAYHPELAMTDADLALVDNFVSRMRKKTD